MLFADPDPQNENVKERIRDNITVFLGDEDFASNVSSLDPPIGGFSRVGKFLVQFFIALREYVATEEDRRFNPVMRRIQRGRPPLSDLRSEVAALRRSVSADRVHLVTLFGRYDDARDLGNVLARLNAVRALDNPGIWETNPRGLPLPAPADETVPQEIQAIVDGLARTYLPQIERCDPSSQARGARVHLSTDRNGKVMGVRFTRKRLGNESIENCVRTLILDWNIRLTTRDRSFRVNDPDYWAYPEITFDQEFEEN